MKNIIRVMKDRDESGKGEEPAIRAGVEGFCIHGFDNCGNKSQRIPECEGWPGYLFCD